MTTLDSTAVEVLGWALVHFAWQGVVAAGVFALLNVAAHGAGARAHRPVHACVGAGDRARGLSELGPSCLRQDAVGVLACVRVRPLAGRRDTGAHRECAARDRRPLVRRGPGPLDSLRGRLAARPADGPVGAANPRRRSRRPSRPAPASHARQPIGPPAGVDDGRRADGRGMAPARDPSSRGHHGGTDRRAARGHPRARAGPRAPIRLPRQPPSERDGNDPLLPPGRVVGVPPHARGARAVLRRRSRGRMWQSHRVRARPGRPRSPASRPAPRARRHRGPVVRTGRPSRRRSLRSRPARLARRGRPAGMCAARPRPHGRHDPARVGDGRSKRGRAGRRGPLRRGRRERTMPRPQTGTARRRRGSSPWNA